MNFDPDVGIFHVRSAKNSIPYEIKKVRGYGIDNSTISNIQILNAIFTGKHRYLPRVLAYGIDNAFNG